MPLFAKILSALVAFAFVVTGLVFLPGAPASAESSAQLSISPAVLSINSGDVVPVSIRIENTGTEPIPAGSITVYGQSSVINQVSDLESWLAAGDGDTQPGRVLGSVDVPEIPAGETSSLTAEFNSAAGMFGYSWGPRGLAATYDVAGSTVSSARSAFVLAAGTQPAAVGYSLITPISAPPTGIGLLTENELVELTSPSGILTRQLDFVSGRNTAIALDPLILASIDALTDPVPESVALWLERLNQLPNTSFLLAYADADLAIQAQTGQQTLLQPGLSDLSTNKSVTPTPSPGGGEASGFTPTLTGVGWPVANTVSESNVAVFSGSGITHSVFSSGNLDTGASRPAMVSAAGLPAAVTNDGFSSALAAADSSRISAYLAAAALDSSTGGILYGALPRDTFSITALKEIAAAVDSTSGVPWSQPIGFRVDGTSPVAINNMSQSAERADMVTAILGSNSSINSFSSIVSDPVVLAGPSSRTSADLLSAGWSDHDAWVQATATNMKANRQVLSSVEIVAGSTVNMVGGQVNIPISIRNALTVPVTVNVVAQSSNARLTVLSSQTIEIASESQKSAQISVRANANNGQATLKVSLTSPTGVAVGQEESVVVNVRAEWESWAIGVLVVCFAGLVIVGVIRTVRKKQSQKSSS